MSLKRGDIKCQIGENLKKKQLIKKACESMLAAVQIYNNPQITFKTETFITLLL